ncbi:TlpA family protein disulfide reductase [Lamprobacter modestohalophilus]|nr:TlpA disulfide reductase family protein [Lamprobacter modestohalophilus]
MQSVHISASPNSPRVVLNSRPAFDVRALILAVLLLVLAPAAMAAESGALLTPLPDQPEAPAFELVGPDERVYRLANFKGQPLIVNFWATWCPPCRAEMPSMQRAWEQLEAEGIGMIAINVGEDAETVQAFLEQVPVSFPLPLDTDSKVTQRWPMRGLPTTFVVAPDGRLVYKATGEREWDDPALLEQVRALKTE